jgi:N6-adenosine-specific RNA methylase IME4/ParB-like chromosome segregation protein Spo0J
MDAPAPHNQPRGEHARTSGSTREWSSALPPLSPAERAALKESIECEGILVPVIRSAGPARGDEIADGRIRVEICRELGLPCPEEGREFATELDFELFRLTVNLRRRQLTDAQRIRLGMLLEPAERERAAQRRAQAKGKPRGEKALPVDRPEERGESAARAAELVGMKQATYKRGAKVLREGSPRLVEDFESGRESVNGAYRRLRSERRRAERDAIARQIERDPPGYPEGRFNTIVIDPAWPLSGLPYPEQTLEEIAAVPVSELLSEDGVVWLWTTNGFLLEAGDIARNAWGLTYRNTLIWDKERIGTGRYLQNATEQVLIFTRGKPLTRLEGHTNIIRGGLREHSRKPEAFYELVEATCPGSKLELYARQERAGWTCAGAESDRFPATRSAEECE